MVRILSLSLVFSALSTQISAKRIEEYSGQAYSNGKHFYTERHKLKYDQAGNLVDAETTYLSPQGEVIAILQSDFRDSLTSPSHQFSDLRTGEVHGVRREKDQLVLFLREKGEPEKSKTISSVEQEDYLTVGCQGLNYYVLQNIERLTTSNPLAIRFLIPGRLDAYNFSMRRVGDRNSRIAEFEIEIKNMFLKLFSPKLFVKYDSVLKQIVFYKGISAIKDDSGRTRTITIDYSKGK